MEWSPGSIKLVQNRTQLPVSYDHGCGPSGSLKAENFLESLKEYQVVYGVTCTGIGSCFSFLNKYERLLVRISLIQRKFIESSGSRKLCSKEGDKGWNGE